MDILFFDIKPLSHQDGVLTATLRRPKYVKNAGDARYDRKQRRDNAVASQWGRIDRRVTARILGMLKTNAVESRST